MRQSRSSCNRSPGEVMTIATSGSGRNWKCILPLGYGSIMRALLLSSSQNSVVTKLLGPRRGNSAASLSRGIRVNAVAEKSQ